MGIRIFAACMFAVLGITGAADKAHAGLFISISVAPPELPVYVQPELPGPDYMWTPGYWAWDEDEGDYYWVPGAWVSAPSPGLLWTPGYWGWSNGVYAWNAGYWGPHVGFYGGVYYGFGYGGVGFAGGRWVGGAFSYNRSVVHVGPSVSITNVYNEKVVVNNTTHVSFNGGNGGVQAQPSARELAYAKEPHTPPTGDQMKHQQLASKNPELKRSRNGGKPSIAATRTAGDFSKKNVVPAKSAGGPKPASLNHSNKTPGTGNKQGTQTPGTGNKSSNGNSANNKTSGPGSRTPGTGNSSSNGNNANNKTSGPGSTSANKTPGTGGNTPKAANLQKKPPPPHPAAKKPPPKEVKNPG